ncbi:hypothetical protein BJ912DRAFT_1081443 [Pholiota molesta]|nr:hypothetical protein BJ912DRAFT_1081443 [Pholiota molesta]
MKEKGPNINAAPLEAASQADLRSLGARSVSGCISGGYNAADVEDDYKCLSAYTLHGLPVPLAQKYALAGRGAARRMKDLLSMGPPAFRAWGLGGTDDDPTSCSPPTATDPSNPNRTRRTHVTPTQPGQRNRRRKRDRGIGAYFRDDDLDPSQTAGSKTQVNIEKSSVSRALLPHGLSEGNGNGAWNSARKRGIQGTSNRRETGEANEGGE